ncbi:hypothetical protein JTB14_004252 [Gonioctena quinquepunctata]|nr:hypothetical protein JTB14_004252 [Gonioctena quinquepunctata]
MSKDNEHINQSQLKLSIIHQNVQSLGNCNDRLENFLSSHLDCTFLCLTEHWKTKEQLKSYGIKGFYLAEAVCREEGEHGGSAIFARTGTQMMKQSKVTSLSTTGICECSVSEFEVHGSKFLIMSVYRPCSGDINDFLANMDEVLLKCLNNNSIIVVAGDFNIPMHNDNKDKENFFALMNSYNLFPTVKDFTRVTSTSQSLIDNIFTNSKEYHSVEVLHNWISDHTEQKMIYYVKRQNKQHIVKRVFNQRNKENFKYIIEKVTWAEVYKSDKVNEAWENFEKYFMYHFNEYFPGKKINVRKKTNESWI